MKINILTLFPKMFDGFKSESIIKRAIEEKKVSIDLCNFRDYSNNKHNKVDDTPYGGGSGMVLMCQPIFDAVNDIITKCSGTQYENYYRFSAENSARFMNELDKNKIDYSKSVVSDANSDYIDILITYN